MESDNADSQRNSLLNNASLLLLSLQNEDVWQWDGNGDWSKIDYTSPLTIEPFYLLVAKQ